MRKQHLNLLLAAICWLGVALAPGVVRAQQTAVSFDSGSQHLYSDSAKTTLLTAGGAMTTGDGAVLELGYFSAATTSAPFAGTFIALSGAASANSAYTYTSIGDLYTSSAGAGQFALSLSFTQGSTTTGNNLPAAGVPLTILFYNGTTIAGSTLFNAVSDPSNAQWLWQAPANPGATESISLDQSGLTWLGGAATAFYTSQSTVPEPSTAIPLAIVLGGVLALRFRARQA